MKLETAIELIKEADQMEKELKDKKHSYGYGTEASQKRHDECLHIARRILLEHYYERH